MSAFETWPFRAIRACNLLSFGPDSFPDERWLPLNPLNVLIGPNGSGKTNLIEAIGLLRNASRGAILPRGGGVVGDWLWKGAADPVASVAVRLDNPVSGPNGIRYTLSLAEQGQRLSIDDERIESDQPKKGGRLRYFRYAGGEPTIRAAGKDRALGEDFDRHVSVLSQREDPEQYPELSHVGALFKGIRLYRKWEFGPSAGPRKPQPADLDNRYLLEDAGNLGLIVSKIKKDPMAKGRLMDYLRAFYDGADDLHVSTEGGTVQLFLEEGDYTTPATRLSDGTLRWIALLGILLNPTTRKRLVCIEEPELGLHPDLMPTLASLLREASERMQLIVTTHSDALVDAFTETPEDVLVCEKRAGQTFIDRLDRAKLAKWLGKYRLGELWSMGEIGGNRW